MNAFSAETSAWKLKTAGQDIATEAHAIALAIKRGDAGHEEIRDRLRSAIKVLVRAEAALRTIENALENQQPTVAEGKAP